MRNKRFMYDLGGDMPNMWLRNSGMLYDPQNEGRVQVDDSVDALGPRCPPTIDEVEHSAAFEIACRYFLLIINALGYSLAYVNFSFSLIVDFPFLLPFPTYKVQIPTYFQSSLLNQYSCCCSYSVLANFGFSKSHRNYGFFQYNTSLHYMLNQLIS